MATAGEIVIVLAGQHFDVGFTSDLAFKLRAAAYDIKITQSIGINALAGQRYRTFFDRQPIGAVIIFFYLTRTQRQTVGVNGGCTVNADAIFVGDNDVGFFPKDLHRTVNIGGFRASYFADDSAGFVLQLGVFDRISTDFGDAVLHAVVKYHSLLINIKITEFIQGNAFRVRIGNIDYWRTVGGLTHRRTLRLTGIRCGGRFSCWR